MESGLLKVTSKVIAHIERATNQEQIAIKSPSSLLKGIIALANKENLISIHIANAITLKLGDTGAIWRSQNKEHEREFDAIFQLLAGYPDQEFEFICSIQ